jgi:hypothetical protein
MTLLSSNTSRRCRGGNVDDLPVIVPYLGAALDDLTVINSLIGVMGSGA